MPQTFALHAMGTRFELVIAGDNPSVRAIGEEALREIARWHDLLGLFERHTELARINREAHEGPVRTDRQVLELLLLCRAVWEQSDGAFDPAIGGAMHRLGFHPGPQGQVSPTNASLADVLIDAAACTVRFARPGIRLDLGAVAKGWAIDQAAAVLREHGVRCALLHGGTSSIAALAAPPGEPGWLIAISGESHTQHTVVLCDSAMGVSAPRGRVAAAGGHIIDPRSGAPSAAACTAAVTGPSAALCDAWSTALAVLGRRPSTMPASYASAIEHSPDRWSIQGAPPSHFSRLPRETAA